MADGIQEVVTSRPMSCLGPFVRRYLGYRLEGFEPGVHRAFASEGVAFMISVGDPIVSDKATHGLNTVVSGPRMSPSMIPNSGTQIGIDVSLTTAGLRALTGAPPSAVAGLSVSLDDLVGPVGVELWDRVQEARSWPDRFEACDLVLGRLIGDPRPVSGFDRAWPLIRNGGGNRSVADLAAATGYSRQHFTRQFRDEFGISPKQASRLVRFKRASGLIRETAGSVSFGRIALACGYYDQSHLHRDSMLFAGCAPSEIVEDNLPFVQDPDDDGF